MLKEAHSCTNPNYPMVSTINTIFGNKKLSYGTGC